MTCYLEVFLCVVIDTWLIRVLVGVSLEIHRSYEPLKLLGIPEDQMSILANNE